MFDLYCFGPSACIPAAPIYAITIACVMVAAITFCVVALIADGDWNA